MSKKAKLIFSEESIEQDVKNYLLTAKDEMFKIADEKAIGKKCKKCGKNKKLKIVPLFTDTYPLPTEIVLYCGDCHNSEALIVRNKNKRMITHMEKLLKMASSAEKFIKKLKK